MLILNTLVGCGAILILGSHPGRDLFDGWLFLVLFLVCAFIQSGAMLFVALAPQRRPHARAVFAMLVLFVAAGFLARTLWPLRLRVLVSEPWLRPHAASVMASRSLRQENGWVGLFQISSEGTRGGMAYMSTGPYGFFGEAGLAYAPSSAHFDRQPLVTYEHLYGPWWRYSVLDD